MPNVRPSRAKKRTFTFAALGLAPALLAGGLVVGGTAERYSNVDLATNGTYVLDGRGHGHGRGLGQWGAYGYAKKGWTAERILRHYYSNTTAGKVGTPDVTVSLSEKSSVSVHAAAGARVGGQTVAPGQAVSLSGGTATITQGCGGAVVRSVPATQVDPIAGGTNRPVNEHLTFCAGGDSYRGSIGQAGGKVINKLHVDDYVKGVIPKESVPSWGDTGGMEALKAQAVAARSYVVAGIAQGRAMDNTQSSQVYEGARNEDPRTSRAADATAGQIRLLNGKPALTEFSASTGGYSAGGTFPAVEDAGDTVSPNHKWQTTLNAGTIASAFGVGSLKNFEVIEANGLGGGSGRVVKVRVTGSSRTVEATGDQARVKLGLKSDWFSIKDQTSLPKIVRPMTAPPAVGGGALEFGQLGDMLQQVIPGLDVLGLTDLNGLSDKLRPLIEQLIREGVRALGVKAAALRSNVAEDHSDNSQGSTGTVSAPELIADGKGLYGLVQVLQNGLLYYSPLTGAHALLGNALTDFLNAGGIAKLGFPTKDGLK